MDQDQKNQKRVSGASVVAFVLGLICLCLGPMGILPIFVGTFALRKQSKTSTSGGRSYAIAGIVLGVVGLLGTIIWGVALSSARETGYFLKAESSIRGHAQGLVIYANLNENTFPTLDQWPEVLIESNLVESDFMDWADRDGDGIGYVYIADREHLNRTQILIYEDPKHWKRGVLVGFADAHVELIDHETFERMLAEQLAAQDVSP